MNLVMPGLDFGLKKMAELMARAAANPLSRGRRASGSPREGLRGRLRGQHRHR